MKEQAIEGFVNDVESGDKKQRGFDKGREIFELPVAIGMALVGGLIGHANRKERDDRGDQIETRVQCFGKNTKAAGADDQKCLERDQDDGGTDAQQRSALFLASLLVQIARHVRRTRLPQSLRACAGTTRSEATAEQ